MDCRGAGLAQRTSLVPLAPIASMATMVLVASAALMAPKLTLGILKTCLQLAATPRDTDGYRSLGRVDKIAGKRDEGLPCKIDGERDEGLSCKIDEERAEGFTYKIVGNSDAGTTRNELKGSRMKVDTANEDVERRTAATWCGPKVADWRVAAVKTFASLAVMASMASMAPLASMASMVWMASMASLASMASMVWLGSKASMVAVTAQNWRNLGRETVLNAPEVLAETRRNTNSGKITVV